MNGCLHYVEAPLSLDGAHSFFMDNNKSTSDEEAYDQQAKISKNVTIASVLIATVAFAAAFTLPGGFVSDEHPHAGAAILASRFAFRAFVVTDTMAFLCSIVATGFLICGSTREIPRKHRSWYSIQASWLVPSGGMFLIGAFALGFHLVQGPTNRGLCHLRVRGVFSSIPLLLPQNLGSVWTWAWKSDMATNRMERSREHKQVLEPARNLYFSVRRTARCTHLCHLRRRDRTRHC